MALKYHFTIKMRKWLLALLVLQILLQSASSGTTRQGNSKKSATSNHNESTDTKEQVALTAEEASDKHEDRLEAGNPQMDEKQSDSTEMSHQGENTTPKPITSTVKSTTSANAGNKATTTVSPKGGMKGTKPGDMKMIKCNTTNDCGQYVGSECIKLAKDNMTRCLCGNLKSPETHTSCKDMKRYVEFPCWSDSHCVANAECKTRNATNPTIQPAGGHATVRACICKSGFERTNNGSECLDELGYFKLQHSKTIHSMLNQLKSLQMNQAEVKQRLQILENSANLALPSISLLIICSSLLAR